MMRRNEMGRSSPGARGLVLLHTHPPIHPSPDGGPREKVQIASWWWWWWWWWWSANQRSTWQPMHQNSRGRGSPLAPPGQQRFVLLLFCSGLVSCCCEWIWRKKGKSIREKPQKIKHESALHTSLVIFVFFFFSMCSFHLVTLPFPSPGAITHRYQRAYTRQLTDAMIFPQVTDCYSEVVD